MNKYALGPAVPALSGQCFPLTTCHGVFLLHEGEDEVVTSSVA